MSKTTDQECAERLAEIRRSVGTDHEIQWSPRTAHFLLAELDRVTAERDHSVFLRDEAQEADIHLRKRLQEALDFAEELRTTEPGRLITERDTALADLKRVEAERDAARQSAFVDWPATCAAMERSRNAWAEKCAGLEVERDRLALAVECLNALESKAHHSAYLLRNALEKMRARDVGEGFFHDCPGNCSICVRAEAALAATDMSKKPENIDTSAGHVDAAATEAKPVSDCKTDSDGACICGYPDKQRIAELEATCATKDEALRGLIRAWEKFGPALATLRGTPTSLDKARAALASDAGKALLERLEKAEEIAAEELNDTEFWKAKAGENLLRAEKAERELKEMEEDADASAAEWRRDARSQAFAECAEIARNCDWLGGSPEGKSSSLRETIANTIEARARGGT